MNNNATIVVTGAAGFIGSCMVGYLNNKGFNNLVLVDEFNDVEKEKNITGKNFITKIERENFFNWLDETKTIIDFVFHFGARTDTTEFDYSIHQHLNVDYSKKIWDFCTQNNIPLIYASSAATYGDGSLGYNDDHDIVEELKPLNPYGISKNEFDKWVIKQVKEKNNCPPFWAGLKFFNVYGPNEYHKGRMASVIFHAYNQVKKNGLVKLFRSHKENFKDGEQLRDFIYVKDLLKVCFWMMVEYENKNIIPGLYNLGTGTARTFNDLVAATFSGLKIPVNIEYINMPADLHGTYQYFTEANMKKLKGAGYDQKFYSLEEGVVDYVRTYLSKQNFFN